MTQCHGHGSYLSQLAWLRQLLVTCACLWWHVLHDRIGVYCIASQPCLGPQDCPVMSFLYCLQDIIYEYGDDTYPTTGKQNKAWLNKPSALHLPDTIGGYHWNHVRHMDSMTFAAMHAQSVCHACQLYTVDGRHAAGSTYLHACLFQTHQVATSLDISRNTLVPWLQMHPLFIVRWSCRH